eukprot:Filipodium_phascolosomae@DN2375_c0_g1_i1.p1
MLKATRDLILLGSLAVWACSEWRKVLAQDQFEAPPTVEEPMFNETFVDDTHQFDMPQKEEDASLVELWDQHMQHFLPDLLVTFSLAARTDEYFYEEVETDEPLLVRGGYFVSGDDDSADVDFQVLSPTGVSVWKQSKSEGIFYFHTTMKGSYSFVVSNHRWLTPKTVTFAVGIGNDTTLHGSHLVTVDDGVHLLERQLKDIQSESGYLWIRQKSHMKKVASTKTRLLWFSILQFVVLIGVSFSQIYYIKALLSARRII